MIGIGCPPFAQISALSYGAGGENVLRRCRPDRKTRGEEARYESRAKLSAGRVTAKAENAVLQGHPWIYDAEITALTGQPENGGLVDAVSRKGRYLGTGLYSKHSKIRLRLVSRNANDVFDDAFWERKLRWAWEYRKAVLREEDLAAVA